MLRIALAGACRRAASCQLVLQTASRAAAAAPLAQLPTRAFSQLSIASNPSGALSTLTTKPTTTTTSQLLSANPRILALLCSAPPARTVTKFSLRKGKRKSVKPVVKRFMRLEWGGWIRTRQGRNKKMWRKTGDLKRRLRQHVFVNATQAHLLDKMVTPFWRRPRHYVDDPYRPYHSREEFTATRTKPLKW